MPRGRRKGSRTLRIEALEDKLFDQVRAKIQKGAKDAKLSFTHKAVRDILGDIRASRSGARINALLERLTLQAILTTTSRERLSTRKYSVTYSLTFYGFLERILAKMRPPDRFLSEFARKASGYLPYDLGWIQDQNGRSDGIEQSLSVAGDHYTYPLFTQCQALAEANPGQSFVVHGTKISLRSPLFYIYWEAAEHLLSNPPLLPGHGALLQPLEERRRGMLKEQKRLIQLQKSRWFKRARERELKGEVPFFVRIRIGRSKARELSAEQWLQEQQETNATEIKDLDEMIQAVKSSAFSDERWKRGYARAFLKICGAWGITIPKDKELSGLFETAIREQRERIEQQEEELRAIRQVAGPAAKGSSAEGRVAGS